MILQVAFKRMQLPSGNAHVAWLRASVQKGQLQLELPGMRGLDSCLAFGMKEFLQSSVLEALDHESDCIVTLYGSQGESTDEWPGAQVSYRWETAPG